MRRSLSKNPEQRPMPGPLGKMLYGRFPSAMPALAFNQAGASVRRSRYRFRYSGSFVDPGVHKLAANSLLDTSDS
jgi:hypothetical protein